MAEVHVQLSKVVDMTDPATQRHYGMVEETLVADDLNGCQRLASRLRQEGVEAIWTYSRADRPDGRQLVVFLDRLKKHSRVNVVKVGRI